jgi:hypothetical protein
MRASGRRLFIPPPDTTHGVLAVRSEAVDGQPQIFTASKQRLCRAVRACRSGLHPRVDCDVRAAEHLLLKVWNRTAIRGHMHNFVMG